MTVGLAIVGTGRWAGAHARAAARSDTVRFVHCVSRSEERRRGFAEDYDIPRHSGELAAALADPDVEGLVVSTPNDLHVSMALQALEAGVPALIDKPVAVDLSEGLHLLRAETSGGPRLGVAHHPRRLAGHRAVKAWLEAEQPDVRMAYANFSNARAAAMKPDAWHRSARGSEAGVLIQVGIHPVENLLFLLGPVRQINARFSYDVLGPDFPDSAAVTMRHASGALSTVATTWTTPSHYALDVFTTKGNLLFRADHAWWTSPDVDAHSRLEIDRDGEEPAPLALGAGDPLLDQLDELGRAARRGEPMGVTVADGLRAVAVVLASVESAHADGRGVDLAEVWSRAGATDEELTLLLG